MKRTAYRSDSRVSRSRDGEDYGNASASRAMTSDGENGRPPLAQIERLTLRLDDVATTLGVSRRAIERERSAGRFPRPDLTIGRMPLWRVVTIREWLENGGHR
jgi:predicted DNA-binding transcriptional regulator AlpA